MDLTLITLMGSFFLFLIVLMGAHHPVINLIAGWLEHRAQLKKIALTARLEEAKARQMMATAVISADLDNPQAVKMLEMAKSMERH